MEFSLNNIKIKDFLEPKDELERQLDLANITRDEFVALNHGESWVSPSE